MNERKKTVLVEAITRINQAKMLINGDIKFFMNLIKEAEIQGDNDTIDAALTDIEQELSAAKSSYELCDYASIPTEFKREVIEFMCDDNNLKYKIDS